MTGPNDRILPPRMVGPDRIFAGIGGMSTSPKTGERGLAGGWSEHSDHLNVEYNCTEYIRRDHAVLAALPEVQEIVRQAVEAEREACAVMQDATAAFYDADAERFRGGTNPHHYRKERAELFRKAAAAIRKRGEG